LGCVAYQGRPGARPMSGISSNHLRPRSHVGGAVVVVALSSATYPLHRGEPSTFEFGFAHNFFAGLYGSKRFESHPTITGPPWWPLSARPPSGPERSLGRSGLLKSLHVERPTTTALLGRFGAFPFVLVRLRWETFPQVNSPLLEPRPPGYFLSFCVVSRPARGLGRTHY
jgi:hypothetical protein